MNRSWLSLLWLLVATLPGAGCSALRTETPPPAGPGATADSTGLEARQLRQGMANGAWESTYAPLPSRPTLIRDATILTATGEEIDGGDLLLEEGLIAAIGPGLEAPAGAVVIDGRGRFVTPGIIDTHSHLGVYPSPGVDAHSEGNEATDPTTAEVWAIHSVWPQDPGFTRALAGGVTTLQILPGSANLIGGRGVTLKPIPGRTAQDMMFPAAPMSLKMACGENPKRVYDERGPSTRMGNWAGYREAFIKAQEYRKKWDGWTEDGGEKPDRDLANETLSQVLRGEILVQNHCYRADDMVNMLNLAREFGFRVRSFHHAVEAYKIRDYLARDSVAASMWTDWWGFKMEAWDMVPQNIALVSEAGARAILHTDDDMGIQIMNQNAARAMYAGRRAGLDVARDEALRWITANPAWALGLEEKIGTLEVGKNADVVIWSGDPFSVYTRADQVFVDGALAYDRSDADRRPVTDFELGILPPASAVGSPSSAADRTAGTIGEIGLPVIPSSGAISLPAGFSAEPARAQDLAIVGGTVYTAEGALVEDATVVIRDGRIAAVGPNIQVPDGTRRIDAAGKIVTPGLFDPASSLGLVEVDQVQETRDEAMAGEADIITAAFDPTIGLNPNSALLPYARLGGVTTAVTGPRGGLIAGQAAVIDLTGETPAEMVAEPGVAMIATYGEAGASLAGGARGAAALRLREVLEDARFWAQNRAAFDRNDARDLSESRLDLEALQPVLAGMMPLVVQVHRASDILSVLAIAEEYGFRPVVLGGAEAWMVAAELARDRVPVILKPLTSLPADFERLGARFDNAAILARAGVPVAFTTFENHRAGQITQEAGNAVRFGMPWEDALAAITRTPAEIYDVADRYGSLDPGKVANVVVWSGDPLELSSHAETVIIRGEVVPEWSRQRELFERYETINVGYPPAYE